MTRRAVGASASPPRPAQGQDDLWHVFESTNDGITISTLDGHVIEVNPAMCAMHGYTREEFLALEPGGHVHPDFRGTRLEQYDRLRSGESYRMRARDLRKDGSEFDIEVHGTAMQFRGELHVLSVVRDISEQVKSETSLEQRVEQRTQELSTLLDVARVTASELDLTALIDRVFEQLASVVKYSAVVITLEERGKTVILARRGPGEARRPGVEGFRRAPLFKQLHDAGLPVVIDDVRGPSEMAVAYREQVGDDLNTRLQHVQSYMQAPLRGRSGYFGALACAWHEPGHYTEESGRLLMAFADHVSVAIENARLFDETQRRSQELGTLLNVARETASTLDLDETLRSIMEHLRSAIECSAVSINIYEGDDGVILARDGPGDVRAGARSRRPAALAALHEAGQPAIIDDVHGHSPAAVSYRASWGGLLNSGFAHVRSYVSAPLRGRDGIFGSIGASWHEPGHFNEEHGRLMIAFADHVSVAIENARLFEETQRRSRELETLLSVARDTASTLDLDETLRRIMERLGNVVPCSAVSISIHEGEDTILLAREGPGDVQPGLRRRRPALSLDRLSGGSAVIIDDVRGDSPEALAYREMVGELLDSGFTHVQSYMTAPLMGRNGIFGAIAVSWHEPRHFTPEHGRLMAAFADHAALAIQNARLFEATQRSAAELSTLLSVARDTASSLDLDQTLRSIMERIRNVIECGAVSIGLYEGDDSVILARDGPGDVRPGTRTRRSAVIQDLHNAGQPAIIDDVHGDTALAASYRASWSDLVNSGLSHVRSFMSAPLRGRDGIFGTIGVSWHEPGHFTAEHGRLMIAFADHTALAIQNARLFEQTQRSAEELSTLLEVARTTAELTSVPDLLDRVLEQLARVMTYSGASVLVFEGADGVLIGRRGPWPVATRTVLAGARTSRLGVLFETTDSLTIDDIHGPSELAGMFRECVGADFVQRLENAHSWLAAALRDRNGLRGLLTVSSTEPGYYNERHAQLLAAFAGHVAVALLNAGLFEETTRRAREMEALHRADEALNRSLELDDVLQAMVDLAVDLLGADASVLYTWDQQTGQGDVVATSGFSDENRALVVTRFRESYPPPPSGSGVMVSEDARTDDSLDQVVVEATGVRSLVELTIVAGGEVFGVFAIGFLAPRTFSASDRQLFSTLATRAGLAIENARLFDETQRRAREMEALHRADEALNRSLELDDVLQAMVDLAVELLGADVSMLYTLDPESDGGHVVATSGLSDEVRALVVERAARSAAPLSAEMVVIEDARNDPALDREIVDATGVRSLVEVRIVAGGQLFGSLGIGFLARRSFSDADRQLFSTLATRAGLAIENARLFEETTRRAREMEALYTADSALHQSLVLDEVLQAMVDVAVDVVGGDQSTILIRDPESGHLIVRANRNLPPDAIARANTDLMRIPLSWDAKAKPRFIPDTAARGVLLPELSRAAEMRALAELPIVVEETVLGYFHIAFREPREFRADDRQLFQALATRAALAIQNAQLYERSQQTASLEERQRLARELHDSVSQALYGIALGTRTARKWLDRDPSRVAEPLDYAISLAEVGLAEMRALIFELRPESLEAEGLVAALQRQASMLAARYEVEVVTEFCEEPELQPSVREALYRIAQEAMHNTVKHASASIIELRLAADPAETRLSVRDNGKGFDPTGDFPGHLGLRSMRERAERLGAAFELESTPGKGTRIAVTTPAR